MRAWSLEVEPAPHFSLIWGKSLGMRLTVVPRSRRAVSISQGSSSSGSTHTCIMQLHVQSHLFGLAFNEMSVTVRKGSSTDGDGVSEASGTEDNAHISSPIRVSPDRREPRVVKRSPRHPEGKDDSRLSAKERLYVSKNAIGKYQL